MFKLRFYALNGSNRGNLDHEEYFDTFAEARERYSEVFDHDLYTLNPTIWEAVDDDRTEWKRVMGY